MEKDIQEQVEEKTEFGKGLTYCLGLFLAHAERIESCLVSYKEAGIEESRAYGIWFNGARDHLFDFEPRYAPNNSLKERCKKFQNKVLGLHVSVGATKEDYEWAIQEAKDLLRLIDKAHGVPTQKGRWE